MERGILLFSQDDRKKLMTVAPKPIVQMTENFVFLLVRSEEH